MPPKKKKPAGRPVQVTLPDGAAAQCHLYDSGDGTVTLTLPVGMAIDLTDPAVPVTVAAAGAARPLLLDRVVRLDPDTVTIAAVWADRQDALEARRASAGSDAHVWATARGRALYAEARDIGVAAVARRVGVTPATVYRYLALAPDAGQQTGRRIIPMNFPPANEDG